MYSIRSIKEVFETRSIPELVTFLGGPFDGEEKRCTGRIV